MDIIPYGTLVSVSIPHKDGRGREDFYGYVRKVEVTETITYFVQFHPDMPYSQYVTADLTIVEGT